MQQDGQPVSTTGVEKVSSEKLQRDGGRRERRHRTEATAWRIPPNHPIAPCRKCIGTNPPEGAGKTSDSGHTGERNTPQHMSENYLPDLPPINSADGSESSKAIGNGPFGLSKGLRKEDLDINMMEIKPCFYRAETLPKKHSAFEYYFLQITPVQGLSWVKAIGNPVATNPYGNELQSAFETMKGKLENIYGRPEMFDFLMHDSIWDEPRDWMQGIANGERRLAAQWDRKKGKDLPSDLQSIFLYAAAEDTHSGYIAIEYAFGNFEASEKEIGMLEDDAL